VNGELGGREILDRLAAIVDHRDVERRHFDRRLKARFLGLLRGERAVKDTENGARNPKDPE
jgi:hypothetical protein